MKVTIIGTGYVGLPTGVCLAEFGNKVMCADKDVSKIDKLKRGEVTLYEKDLEELLNKNLNSGQIKFTSSIKEAVSKADIIIIAVGTPPNPVTHEADLQYIFKAAEEISPYIKDNATIAIKSTVPVGTGDKVEMLIRNKNNDVKFDLISLPEFLREGYAIYDFMNPDRIVVGTDSERAYKQIQALYKTSYYKEKMIKVSRRSSELIKYASNAFLAMKIQFINELANLCESVDADILEVSYGMGKDSRIGNKFLNAGIGYGGSCFPKDTQALSYIAKLNNVKLNLVDETILGNYLRIKQMANRILDAVKEIKNPKIAILGLAFKNGTDDCRESPSINIIKEILNKTNANISAYDPKAMENAYKILGDKIKYAKNEYEASENADVLVILTEWGEFANIDLDIIESKMQHKKILDFKNMLNYKLVLEKGFSYSRIGRK